MSRRQTATTRSALRTSIAAASRDAWGGEMLEAFVTAAALVSRADNWVQPVERGQLLDFLDRVDLLSIVAREDIALAFERCVRELREPRGVDTALSRLGRLGGRSYAPLLVELGEEVAAADCRLDPREQEILALIRAALGADAARPHAPRARPGEMP